MSQNGLEPAERKLASTEQFSYLPDIIHGNTWGTRTLPKCSYPPVWQSVIANSAHGECSGSAEFEVYTFTLFTRCSTILARWNLLR